MTAGQGVPAPSAAPADGPPAYAVGWLRNVRMGPDIAAYLRGIDATLAPHGGRFLIHGGPVTPLEGWWEADLIVIAFPSARDAAAWYASEAYQALLPLRTGSSEGLVAIVEGTEAGHRATDILRGGE
ncbi:DUF1330 domain-containing protein [Acuticoccus kandeliae]|uniref:DUF1330 domain-containing protein n=1 Tax=Acuticoccus kandeliae TaxID=2073160 RepID=UPI001FEBC1C1|nr:DUF1330 domain-containing protein [Acuticoccus kandeliae]